ncbi:MAG: hypothetical protein QM831_41175 [Kofleriaceae bacterium]
MADDAGALLVRSGLVTSSALESARARVTEVGGTIGEQLVATGVVADDALTDFYKTRLLVPQVNPNTLARLPAKVIGVIPNEMAVELRVVPVSLDPDNNLLVAMSDPSDRHAVDEISFFTGAYVVRAVATQMQIAWCLAHYYGHVTNLGQRLLRPEQAEAEPVKHERKRGITEEVEKMRHKGIVPGEAVAEAPDEPAAPSTERRTEISGEIRIGRRAQSIKPPMPDDSGPVITMEVDDTSGPVEPPPVIEPPASVEVAAQNTDDEDTGRAKPVPRRKRPADPDPPELAARAGEIGGRETKDRELDKSGPSIVIDLEDGVPEPVERVNASALHRARSASGEIQVHGLREVSGEIAIVRPSGERARSEISIQPTGEDDSAPVMIHESLRAAAEEVLGKEPSAPVLLERKRPSDPPPAAPVPSDDDDDGEVVELNTKKTQPIPVVAEAPKRVERRTEVGIGVVGGRPQRDTIEAIPAQLEDDPTGKRALEEELDDTRIDGTIAPAPDDMSSDEIAAPPAPVRDDDTSPHILLPPRPNPTPPPSNRVDLSNVKRAPTSDDDEEEEDIDHAQRLRDVIQGKPTIVMPAVTVDDDDDEWGPPGQTIPPPFLGAIPGALDRPAGSGVIPIADVDSQPLMVAPPSPPEHPHRPHTNTEAGVARALEQATMRVLDLIRDLEHAQNRDEVIAVMIAHLSETHRRAGFFAVRSNELVMFSITPNIIPLPTYSLRLDRPSTLGDVVNTRLPYRGPMHDEASRHFLDAVLGMCPPEILLVPITVRDRVVGVLFGEHRMRHTFDDQLALASRAAGDALERILKAKRS